MPTPGRTGWSTPRAGGGRRATAGSVAGVGPSPEVAAVRRAVRSSVRDLEAGALVLVACSGGPDSVALAVALAFEAPRAGLRAGGVTVDHRLQPGSAARATQVADDLRALGLDPVEATAVDIVPAADGPEAAARQARYRALDEAADRLGAATVLLGHTRDDQAETVLLGLARGSGARSLAGMAAVRGRYRRPLLGLDRATVRAAAAGHRTWDDPHNADPAFARARVRRDALPMLERELGPGIAEALARSADLLRADADALDGWAADAHSRAAADDPAGRPRRRRPRGAADRRTHPGAATRSEGRRRPGDRPDRGARRRAGPAGHRLAGPGPAAPAGGRGGRPGVWQADAVPPAAQQSMREHPPRGREAPGHRPREGAHHRGADPHPAGRDGGRHRRGLRGQGPAASSESSRVRSW